ncbi:TnsA endonuclease N-terminal domain-containing protein [Neptunomonas sp.]|uniref:TnsA endonuclease N-terminal domain-containing protein n=1 Tax=Neptunomonas sp. TaxID=1971898 RepID=UPI003565E9B2
MARTRADLIKRADKWIKEGLSELTGRDYTPFLTVRDVPSLGRRQRATSWTVGRLHHLLSNGESDYFYLSDFDPDIMDIREQYPLLPYTETLSIATKLGVKHPYMHGELHIMTTDFLLTSKSEGLIPVAIKLSKELEKRRTIEKIDIERSYWKKRGLELKIVTEHELNTLKADAIKFIHKYRSTKGLNLCPTLIINIQRQLEKRHSNPFQSAAKLADQVDDDLHLIDGTSLAVIRHLIASTKWLIDMDNGIDTTKPLVFRG